MVLRKVILAALVCAPLAMHATPVEAQRRGVDQAAEATAQAESVAGWTKNQAAKRPDALPAGVQKVFGSGTLPPGMSRTREVAAPPTGGEAPTEPSECATEVVVVDGLLWIQDCHGNLTPLSGG